MKNRTIFVLVLALSTLAGFNTIGNIDKAAADVVPSSFSWVSTSFNWNNEYSFHSGGNYFVLPFGNYKASDIADMSNGAINCICKKDPAIDTWIAYYPGISEPNGPSNFQIERGRAYYVFSQWATTILITGSITYQYFTQTGDYILNSGSPTEIAGGKQITIAHPGIFDETIERLFNPITVSSNVEIQKIWIYDNQGNSEELTYTQARKRIVQPYQLIGIQLSGTATWNMGNFDWFLPELSITSPSAGSIVSGRTTISVSTSDNSGISKVEFYIDGSLKNTDSSAPYSFTWFTYRATNWKHTITVISYDNFGNSNSASMTVKVMNNLPIFR